MKISKRDSCVLLVLFILLLVLPSQGKARQFPDCKKCHKYKDTRKVVHPAITAMGCPSCHTQPHQKNAKFPKFLFAEGTDLCFGCHDKAPFSKDVKHPPVAEGQCLFCHDVHSADNEKLLQAPMPDLCFNCHDETKFNNNAIHPPVQAGQCTGCHNPHSSEYKRLLYDDPPKLCFNCHDKTTYIDDDKTMHHSPVKRGLCLNCHDPHAAPGERLLRAEIPDICFKCHSKFPEFTNERWHPPVKDGMCMMCHEPHQADYRKLLSSDVPALCFNCHDSGEFERRNQHPPVSAGMCTVCHNVHTAPDVAMLKYSINRTCLNCHPGIAEGPHAITNFFSQGHPLEGRKDPRAKYGELSCVSCHNPHSSDYMRLFRYKAEKVFDLCKNCHQY